MQFHSSADILSQSGGLIWQALSLYRLTCRVTLSDGETPSSRREFGHTSWKYFSIALKRSALKASVSGPGTRSNP